MSMLVIVHAKDDTTLTKSTCRFMHMLYKQSFLSSSCQYLGQSGLSEANGMALIISYI